MLQVADPEHGVDCLLKNSVSFFFTQLQKDESCVQSKACLSFLLPLTVESLIHFFRLFVSNVIFARQLCFNILVNRYNGLILQD